MKWALHSDIDIFQPNNQLTYCEESFHYFIINKKVCSKSCWRISIDIPKSSLLKDRHLQKVCYRFNIHKSWMNPARSCIAGLLVCSKLETGSALIVLPILYFQIHISKPDAWEKHSIWIHAYYTSQLYYQQNTHSRSIYGDLIPPCPSDDCPTLTFW